MDDGLQLSAQTAMGRCGYPRRAEGGGGLPGCEGCDGDGQEQEGYSSKREQSSWAELYRTDKFRERQTSALETQMPADSRLCCIKML